LVFIDSDLAICFLRKKNTIANNKAKKIFQKFIDEKQNIKMTIFNYAELFRGAYLSKNVAHNLQIIEEFVKNFQIMIFTEKEAVSYAKIYADLKLKRENIGDFDELIASIVISNDDVLYTRNLNHFERIKLLKIINWCD